MKSDIMSGERILIDTSVWIEYFRDKSTSLSKKVEEFLEKQEIFVPKIVIAELIQGSKSEQEISVIEDFVDAFNVIDQMEDTWIKAGRLSYRLKKKGKRINLTDCYIAILAQENNCSIFSLDEHFKDIHKSADIGLIDPS
jgi:tRNA(fMet)-specific endonuclease VapC